MVDNFFLTTNKKNYLFYKYCLQKQKQKQADTRLSFSFLRYMTQISIYNHI